MSEAASAVLPEDAFKQWKPEVQARALELARQDDDYKPFFCPDRNCLGTPHGENWNFNHARPDQRPPNWKKDWLTWLLKSGRGAGKTRTGSEVINRVTELVPRIGLVGATGPDFRETMIEGPTGILACAPKGKMPTWEPSRKRLTWPNGCVAQGFSGEEPDRIRGGNFAAAWVDEPAHIDLIEEVWGNLLLALRIGAHPHIICTTTPTPTKWMKKLIADPKTITVTVSTYANLDNLSPVFRQTVLESYEGTRWGRQELYGEILEDVEGSLWKAEMFHYINEDRVPDLERIVVAVDPAGSCNVRSDETGIIGLGVADGNIYVLADRTGKYSPQGWADAAHELYEDLKADCIVAEKNYGGDMVKHTLETTGYKDVLIKLADSRRGKQLRAEPCVALYERGLVFHVSGPNHTDLVDLENEQCFRAGTKILTDVGVVPIESVTLKHRVWTRKGWAPLAWCGQTGESDTFTNVTHSLGTRLESTTCHPIWTQTRGFVPARNVSLSDHLLVVPQSPPLLLGEDAGIGASRTGITRASKDSCTDSSGRRMSAQSQMDTSSITRTMTLPTITSATSNPSRLASITGSTTRVGSSENSAQSGDHRKPRGSGKSARLVKWFARHVGSPSSRQVCEPSFAPSLVEGVTTVRYAATEPVYNLMVAEGWPHEYVANGVLVHNCEWVPGKGSSPNRVDALVHGATELIRGWGGPSYFADPNKVLRGLRAPTSRYLS